VVFGSGGLNPRILVIAEAPGALEDQEGEPLVGPTGKLLDYMLAKESGIDQLVNFTKTFDVSRIKWPDHKNCKNYLKQFVYYDNTCMCYPNRPSGDKKPDRDNIKACRDRLLTLIYTLNPTIILCVGAVALSGLKGKPVTILKERGKLFDLYIKGHTGTELAYPVLPIIHPSYLLRSNNAQVRNKSDGPWQNTYNDIKFMYHLLAAHDQILIN
jgi:DNA polymerase